MPAAQWYTVQLGSPPQGVVGQTMATIVSGGLHVDSQYDADGDGTALVYAENQSDAIQTAVTGGVIVNLSAVNLPTATYTFNPNTSTTDTGTHTLAFGLEPTVPLPPPTSPPPTGPTQWKVWLEDLTADPDVSDWDYNDFYWTVSVGNFEPPPAVTLPTVSASADAAWVSGTAGQTTTATFTITRTDDTTQPLTVGYAASFADADDELASGTATIAAGQATVIVAVEVPVANDTARIVALRILTDGTQGQTAAYTADGTDDIARTTVYSDTAIPSVSVAGGGTVANDDPNAVTSVNFTATRESAAPSSSLSFRYQTTIFDGADNETAIDGGIHTAAFAFGATSATFSVAIPAGIDPLTIGRRVSIRILPPINPGSYTPKPDWDVADLLVMQTKQVAKVESEQMSKGENGDHPAFTDIASDFALERVTRSYTRGTKVKLSEVKIELPADAFEGMNPPKAEDIRLKATAVAAEPPGGDPIKAGSVPILTFTVNPGLAVGSAPRFITVSNVKSDQALPLSIEMYRFRLQWEISWTGDSGKFIKINMAAQPPYELFTTYKKPEMVAGIIKFKPRTGGIYYTEEFTANLLRSMMQNGTLRGTTPPATPTPEDDSAFIKKAFTAFESRTFTRYEREQKDGKDSYRKVPLYYYNAWKAAGSVSTDASTLVRKEGNNDAEVGKNMASLATKKTDCVCDQWAMLFQSMLHAHGIKKNGLVTVNATQGEMFLIKGQWDEDKLKAAKLVAPKLIGMGLAERAYTQAAILPSFTGAAPNWEATFNTLTAAPEPAGPPQ